VWELLKWRATAAAGDERIVASHHTASQPELALLGALCCFTGWIPVDDPLGLASIPAFETYRFGQLIHHFPHGLHSAPA